MAGGRLPLNWWPAQREAQDSARGSRGRRSLSALAAASDVARPAMADMLLVDVQPAYMQSGVEQDVVAAAEARQSSLHHAPPCI